MTPAFFGYGSLVNRATHDYPSAHRASLSGYRRVWRATRLRQLAFLSIEPADCTIHGLVADVPGADWSALDAREAAYTRSQVTPQITGSPHPQIWAYAVTSDPLDSAPADHPILLSYLDAVLQGFLQEYGDAGLDHFLSTTSGWDHPIQNDRSAPIYPRAQTLSEQDQSLIDEALRHL